MLTNQVQIGRRSVPLDTFKQAIASNIKVKDVCDCLGFNSTVGTTKQAIKDRIEELGLDTSHFKWNYTVSEAVLNRKQKNYFRFNEDNQKYFYAFQEYRTGIDKNSWATYKASIKNYMNILDDRDFATVTMNELMDYANKFSNSKNILAHLRSLMIFIVKKEINGALEKADRRMLAALITMREGEGRR